MVIEDSSIKAIYPIIGDCLQGATKIDPAWVGVSTSTRSDVLILCRMVWFLMAAFFSLGEKQEN